MKNPAAIKGANKHSRLEKAFGVALPLDVTSGIHRYTNIRSDAAHPFWPVRLPRDSFEAAKNKLFMQFQVSGPSPRPSWHSPSAQNCGQRDSDLPLLRPVGSQDAWSKLGDCWMGALVVCVCGGAGPQRA